jgi:cell envelope opacity-associated protein A
LLDSAKFHQADITKLLYIPDKKMMISAGKDCYMKFWHILPENRSSTKDKPKFSNEEKEDLNKGYQEWTGEQDSSESEEEPSKPEPKKTVVEEKKIKKDSPKKVSPKKEKPKKQPEPAEPSSEEEDDDLTGWY